jgi:hypothetical protein
VLANHRCRLHNHQRAAPIEPTCQDSQANATCSIDPSRLDAAFYVGRQLAESRCRLMPWPAIERR